MGGGDIDARIVRHDPSLDEVDSFGRWSLVVCREWVGCDVGSFWRQNHLFVNEILNLVTQPETLVCIMTVLLVICTVLGWVVSGG